MTVLHAPKGILLRDHTLQVSQLKNILETVLSYTVEAVRIWFIKFLIIVPYHAKRELIDLGLRLERCRNQESIYGICRVFACISFTRISCAEFPI